MDHHSGCCGMQLFDALDPAKQADYLTVLAHDARILQFSLGAGDPDTRRIGDRLQRAIEQAMDADTDAETAGARQVLEEALAGARAAGMVLSAQLDEMDVDGVLGTMKMLVLTTVLAPQPATA